MKNTLLSLSIFLIIIAVISSINLALFYQQWNLMLLCIEFIKSLALFSVAYIGFRLIKRLCKQNLKTACVDSNKKHFMLKIFLYCIAVCICAIVTAILIKHPSVSFAFDVFLIEVIILVLSLSLWILFYFSVHSHSFVFLVAISIFNYFMLKFS
ncbi:hypothetical protein CCZ01_07640 [Helicobacter monodelphidis]|uniref:hypothetical protein n=1 Tax=Helicobacter sp. 15-1451 TaxID=2004995 RepID=UPI000DCB511F|nr:hypothetical protein [Helicobacter sp. 15-1451]RAX57031.1 hypothetical protein CCZ01_07640 [Helicobacter sp. 15-1451]